MAGGLDGRAFQIRAEKEGFVPASLNNVDPGTSDLLIALQPGGAVAGVVTDASGAPVRKFRINTSRQGENPNPMDWQRFSGQLAGREFEDPEGRFRVDGLEPGTFTVEARAADQAPGRVEGVVVEAARDTAVAVTLSAVS